ncbi:putative Ribosome biogenesis ATPase RIX7 [Paratrimastix pyriformis]|uniref:Ribosome biogenesis ATPase RIX7 n=1 Tax=Paratrimastix pyriformis TaxID=342808 RepID=A0ABQ8US64_9EUKA|nr:putative Ribosome biogenesis ATPase RIX7 [Paratrimastix pyriformis]
MPTSGLRRRRRVSDSPAVGTGCGTGGLGGDAEGESGATAPVSHRTTTHYTLNDVAGIEKAVTALREVCEHPLNVPSLFTAVCKVPPPRGILLVGPSGCGKTLLAQAMAGSATSLLSPSRPALSRPLALSPSLALSRPPLAPLALSPSRPLALSPSLALSRPLSPSPLTSHRHPSWSHHSFRSPPPPPPIHPSQEMAYHGVTFLTCNAPELVSGVSGESEANIRALFAEAEQCSPSLLFLDDIDAIAPRRETAQREMERRIVSQLTQCMEALGTSAQAAIGNGTGVGAGGRPLPVYRPVIVIAATSRPDSIDTVLRGRFDREVELGVPDEKARLAILKVLTRPLRLDPSVDLNLLAQKTPGSVAPFFNFSIFNSFFSWKFHSSLYVGGDLRALASEATGSFIQRITRVASRLARESVDATPVAALPPPPPQPPATGRQLQASPRTRPPTRPQLQLQPPAHSPRQPPTRPPRPRPARPAPSEDEHDLEAEEAAAAEDPDGQQQQQQPQPQMCEDEGHPEDLVILTTDDEPTRALKLRRIERRRIRAMVARLLAKRAARASGEAVAMAVEDQAAEAAASDDEDAKLLDQAITMADFDEAIKRVQPSAMREGFETIPNVTWDDVGALDDLRAELQQQVVLRIRYPDFFTRYNINQSVGILLYGPPGCGKTLLAKALARESGATFISIKGPELLNKYVGESERAVRAPCVVFFDELDALSPKRSGESNAHMDRVVDQLLTEMDGVGAAHNGVFVIGATNRRELIDEAMLRPGRLGKELEVPLPDAAGRLQILKAATRHTPLEPALDLRAIADQCPDGFSGADLAALANEASLVALREDLARFTAALPQAALPLAEDRAPTSAAPAPPPVVGSGSGAVGQAHFQTALKKLLEERSHRRKGYKHLPGSRIAAGIIPPAAGVPPATPTPLPDA